MRTFLKAAVVMMCLSSRLCFALDTEILAEYSHKLTAQMCKGNTEWTRCYGIDPLNCERQSQDIIDRCMQQYVFDRAAPVQSEAEVHIISQQLYGCIRASFSRTFDSQKKDSPECQGLE